MRLCLSFFLFTLSLAAEPLRPNVLIIIGDDCTYNDLPIYGGVNAHTPHLDKLAAEGLTFNRAYLSAAMCQPCRAELYTGQYPQRNGCAWNHSACRPGTQSLPHYLAPAGYRTGIAGKVHVAPKASFPFEDVPGFDANSVRSPTRAHDLAGVREFISREKAQPFCLVVGLTEPHVPWVMGDRTRYPTDQLKLPKNLANTLKTREDFAAYLAEITSMDAQVGELLHELESSGVAEDTLVLFTSEQGSQFPGNKWTCWDTGLHTALIARWPGKVTANSRTDALVQYADILPTLLELASVSTDARLDGSSFAGVLRGTASQHRDYVYAVHNNIPEGPAYPIRSVSDGEWRYIRNLTPGEIFIEKHLMGLLGGATAHNAYWPSWMATAVDDPHTYQLVKRYLHRPAEELYHTAVDPAEMTNLATSQEHQAIKMKLSAALDRWMESQGDPGLAMDTQEAHQAAKRGAHLHPAKP
jgi:N-sulfoglucosamine sulfohydrolase